MGSPSSSFSSTETLSDSDDQGGSSSDYYASPEASPSPRKRANTRAVTSPFTLVDEECATQLMLDEAVANAASDEDPAETDAWVAGVVHNLTNEWCGPHGSH